MKAIALLAGAALLSTGCFEERKTSPSNDPRARTNDMRNTPNALDTVAPYGEVKDKADSHMVRPGENHMGENRMGENHQGESLTGTGLMGEKRTGEASTGEYGTDKSGTSRVGTDTTGTARAGTDKTDAWKTSTGEYDTDEVKATDTGMSATETSITAAIRREIMSDSSLSFSAKNTTVITVGSRVTLRGEVPTERERTSLVGLVKATSGVTEVDNQLEVKDSK